MNNSIRRMVDVLWERSSPFTLGTRIDEAIIKLRKPSFKIISVLADVEFQGNFDFKKVPWRNRTGMAPRDY